MKFIRSWKTSYYQWGLDTNVKNVPTNLDFRNILNNGFFHNLKFFRPKIKL